MQPTPEFLRSLHGPSLQTFLDTPTFGTLAEAFNWEKSPQGTDFWKRAYSAALLMGAVHGDDYEIVQGFMNALEAMNKQQGQKRVICKTIGYYKELHDYQGLFASFVISANGIKAMKAAIDVLVQSGHSVWEDDTCIAGELGDMLSSDNMA